jgi:hypothetical protein
MHTHIYIIRIQTHVCRWYVWSTSRSRILRNTNIKLLPKQLWQNIYNETLSFPTWCLSIYLFELYMYVYICIWRNWKRLKMFSYLHVCRMRWVFQLMQKLALAGPFIPRNSQVGVGELKSGEKKRESKKMWVCDGRSFAKERERERGRGRKRVCVGKMSVDETWRDTERKNKSVWERGRERKIKGEERGREAEKERREVIFACKRKECMWERIACVCVCCAWVCGCVCVCVWERERERERERGREWIVSKRCISYVGLSDAQTKATRSCQDL